MIPNEIFLIRFKYFLAFYVIPWYPVNYKSSFQCIQVIINCIDINFPILTFKIVNHISGRKLISNIIKYKSHHPFQKFDIPDFITLYNIAQDYGRINIIHYFHCGFLVTGGHMQHGETSCPEIFRECPVKIFD